MKVIYIDVDTMSPSHMGCYGYQRNTCPNIDAIASEDESAVFTNMYTSDAPCLPSRTSLIIGQFGIKHGAVNHGGKYADLRSHLENRDFQHAFEFDSLFGLFKRKDYKTISVSSFTSRHSSWQFNAGVNEVYCDGDSATQNADEITGIASKVISDNIDENDMFLHIHMWDPHTPYRAPDDFQPEYLNEDFKYFVDEKLLETHKTFIGPHTATTLNMYSGESYSPFSRDIGTIRDMNDLKTVVDGYDVGISYSDHHVGKIVTQLKESGVYDDAMIIISAGHGENIGEMGVYSEHGTADHATCNIPFIVKIPKGTKVKNKIDSLHYNLDLVPTVATMLDLKPQSAVTKWDGESFLGEMLENESNEREYLILSQMSHVLQRGVRFENYVYIQTYHDGYHAHFDEEMLFDLTNDPFEQTNIAHAHPDLVAKAKVHLFDWYNTQMSELIGRHCEDPLWYILHNGGPYHAQSFAPLLSANLERIGEVEKSKLVQEIYESEF